VAVAGNLLTVGVSGLRDFARDLRLANKVWSAEMGRDLRAAAGVIADEAKIEASWSRRIPGSIVVRGAGPNVRIVAGGPRAPHAITFEAPEGTPRRHPVYARGKDRTRWTWVAQTPRPYLRTAADRKGEEALDRFARIIDRWADRAGFK
jgi:hypothetical protein